MRGKYAKIRQHLEFILLVIWLEAAQKICLPVYQKKQINLHNIMKFRVSSIREKSVCVLACVCARVNWIDRLQDAGK